MKYLNRKNVIFFMLIVLLGVSTYLNRNYNNDQSDNAKVLGEAAYVNNEILIEEEDVFEDMKIKRDASREEALKSLNELIDNPETTEGTKTDAENKVLFINQSRIQETDCENIIKNKGIEDVMISINESGVNVFVKKKELHPNEIAMITETVKNQTPFSEDMIKISVSD